MASRVSRSSRRKQRCAPRCDRFSGSKPEARRRRRADARGCLRSTERLASRQLDYPPFLGAQSAFEATPAEGTSDSTLPGVWRIDRSKKWIDLHIVVAAKRDRVQHPKSARDSGHEIGDWRVIATAIG